MPWIRLGAAALACIAFTAHAAPAPLPPLNIDASRTTVSGASSGGYMAVQLHVAHSTRFKGGAAVIAGGPFNCAQGSVMSALTRCLGNAAIPVADLVAATDQWAKEGAIDPTSNLAASKVYLFSGAKDSVVKEATTTALHAYYKNYIPAAQIVLKADIQSEHGFVTDDTGAACLTKDSPFIINCGFDLAGALLQHLYGPLKARKSGALEGSLVEFDQSAFVTGHGMGTAGWVYVPASCTAGTACRLHVALHGCRQNADAVKDAFARNAGYNRWADGNDIVVLYPQTGKGATNACWDWWGYDDPNYAKKSAPQMKAIIAMMDRLARAGYNSPATR